MRVTISDGVIECMPNAKMLELEGEHMAHPDSHPAQPKLAATVMLVRDSKPGQTSYRIEDGNVPSDFPNNQNVEVFMFRRVKAMDFAPDAVAFPDGRVDERDANPDLPWCGPSPAE